MALLRVAIDGSTSRHVAYTERLMEGRFGRLRDVVMGPDGFLYICTSNRDGRDTPVAEDDRLITDRAGLVRSARQCAPSGDCPA